MRGWVSTVYAIVCQSVAANKSARGIKVSIVFVVSQRGCEVIYLTLQDSTIIIWDLAKSSAKFTMTGKSLKIS